MSSPVCIDCCRAEGAAPSSVFKSGKAETEALRAEGTEIFDRQPRRRGWSGSCTVLQQERPEVRRTGSGSGSFRGGGRDRAASWREQPGPGFPHLVGVVPTEKTTAWSFPLRMSLQGIVTLTSSVLPTASGAGGRSCASGRAAGAAGFAASGAGASRRTTAALLEIRRSSGGISQRGRCCGLQDVQSRLMSDCSCSGQSLGRQAVRCVWLFASVHPQVSGRLQKSNKLAVLAV